MRFFIIITVLASLAPWAVFPTSAQFGNPGGLDPATRESAPGVPAPGQTNIPDRLFTTLAAQGGIAEVELGKLAQQKSRNEMVSAFAQQMIDDHSKSNTQLAQLAKEVGLPLPSEPAPDQLQTRQKLSMLSQEQFEAEYMRVQVTEHQKTVQLLLWVIASGENSDLHHFASETLPTVLHQLQRAQNLVSQLTGAVTP